MSGQPDQWRYDLVGSNPRGKKIERQLGCAWLPSRCIEKELFQTLALMGPGAATRPGQNGRIDRDPITGVDAVRFATTVKGIMKPRHAAALVSTLLVLQRTDLRIAQRTSQRLE